MAAIVIAVGVIAVGVIAVGVIAVGVPMVAAKPIGEFVGRHPTLKVLALSFLVVVGVVLLADGFGQHVPKGTSAQISAPHASSDSGGLLCCEYSR